MRTIKFRGKRVDTNEWVYGSLIEDKYIVGNVIDWNEDYFNTEYWWKVIPETVGQFTGLYDKNGKEIYEGDLVVYYASGFARIEFVAGGFHIIQEEYGFDFMGQMLATIEVIGNIFDNKELL